MNPRTRVSGWRWNRAHNSLVADVQVLEGGHSYEVRFPVRLVATDYGQILQDCGCLDEAEAMGFVDVIHGESVDGFLSKIRKATRRAVKTVATQPIRQARAIVKHPTRINALEPPALRRARRRLMGKRLRELENRYERQAHRAAMFAHRQALRAGRSKALGSGLGVAATAFPAVGGPALGAWVAAHQYAKRYDEAKRIAKHARMTGKRLGPKAHRLIAQGQQLQRGFQNLKYRQDDPRARLLLGALRTI